MTYMKRWIKLRSRLAVLMSALMLISPVFISCTDSGSGKAEETTAAATEGITEQTTAAGHELSDLPDTHDLSGYEYRIMNSDYSWDNFRCNLINAKELTAEILNDTVYNRNLMLKDKYNFKITEISTGAADPTSSLTKSVLAGEDVCDVAVCTLSTALKSVYSNIFVDVEDVPNINITKSYWDQGMIEQLSLKGVVYFLSGDILLSDDDSLSFTMYNRQMADGYGIENLYDTTREGKWTYDKMMECIKTVITDLNNDSKFDQNDVIGVLYHKGTCFNAYLASCNVSLCYTDADENIQLISDTTHAVDAYDKIAQLLTTQGYAYDWTKFGNAEVQANGIITMIESKQALFSNMIISQVRRFYRNIATDFGILPMPKLDESQESYITSGTGSHALFIPSTNIHLEETGFITEAMAAASYELTDVYYHTALESKYTRDAESYEMIELGTEKIIYDMAAVYGWGSLYSTLNSALHSGVAFTSIFTSGRTATAKLIEVFLASIEKKGS